MRNLDVLVIDDNKTTRDMLRALLEFEGHNVSCCENGKSGLELMKSKHFEIIVTDYLMPEMNGDEVTKLARRFSPDSFIIGCSVDAKARQFVDAGAHAFFSKDHVVYQLARLIEQRASLMYRPQLRAPAEYSAGGLKEKKCQREQRGREKKQDIYVKT
jgi:CheY-like chemotaxis protein